MKKKTSSYVDPLLRMVNPDRLLSIQTLMVDYETTVHCCNLWKIETGWEVAWRKRVYSFFFIPELGNFRVTVGSRQMLLKPGGVAMVPENVFHSIKLASGGRKASFFILHCHIQDHWGRPFLLRLASPFATLPDRESWCHAMRETSCLMNNHPKAGQVRAESLLRELLASHLAKSPQALLPLPAGDARVSAVVEAIHRSLDSADLSIKDLAKSVDLSIVHLRTLFEREVGMGPKQFLKMMRMRKAAHLLNHSTMSIKEIALRCGFASDHYFHPAFRKEFGCAPNQYRLRAEVAPHIEHYPPPIYPKKNP